MKRKILWCVALLAILFISPTWAHHPAEGIISDDIWQMIDANLEEVDSPHLYIDFDDVMDSMRVSEDSDRGSLFLVTSIKVFDEDVADYVYYIDLTLVEMAEMGEIPPGLVNSGNSNTLDYQVIDDPDSEYSYIEFYEPIGAVNSQSVDNPGKRN